MAATIKIKNSSTAGAAPTSSDLVQGELAVNVTDKRLYTENASGTIVELGTNPSVPVTFPDGSASAPSLTNDGDTNTGLFFPAADTVGITTGGSERARIDSSGNLGLGVTPSAWTVFNPVLQIKTSSGAAALTGNANDNIRLFNNAYYDGAYKRIGAGYASYYEQDAGKHAWHYAGTSTAGSTITFTQAMTLDASGNLGVGTTSPVNKIHVVGSATTNVLRAQASSSGDGIVLRPNAAGNGGDVFSVNSAQDTYTPLNLYGSRIVFGANGTESARIDSSGNLLVGTTSTIGTGKFQVRGGIFGDNSSVDQNLNIECRTGGTLYSNSIYSSTTAAGASVSITGTAGYLQRSTSSIKYKTDVEDMDSTKSESIYQMRPVWYRSKCATDRKDWSYYGLIAEEIAEIEPRLVHWGEVKEDGTQEPEGVMYDRLTVLLLSEIKKQQAIIEQLQADVAALKG